MKRRILVSVIMIMSIASSGICGECGPTTFSIQKYGKEIPQRDRPWSLPYCYALALKQSEVVAISVDEIRITEARFLQALSIILPHVSFLSTDMREETPPSPSVSSSATGAEFVSLEPHTSSERRFYVRQTLFNGFKAFAAVKGAMYERRQRVNETVRAEQLLLVDVSDAFYLLVEKREDLKALRRIKKALVDRIAELRDRERLGRSRQSEVVNAQAQLYNVQADIEVARNQEVLTRQLLEFLTGQSVVEVADLYEIPQELMEESYYVSKSDNRPDVAAAKYAWQVSRKEAQMVDSDFLPVVDVEADAYTQRTGFNKGVDWDVFLKVTVPIFEGTETLGRSKEYWVKSHQKELQFKRTRRKAPYDIKDAYARLKTAIAIQDSLKHAFTTAKLNYYLQRKDYERSLVNNLDVLASIQTLQTAQRNYIHALYEAKRLYWQLRVAIGESVVDGL